MNRVYLNIGSNYNAEQKLRESLQQLHQTCQIVNVSRVFESPNVKCLENCPNFLNICVEIATPLSAELLKYKVLRKIERLLGRNRDYQNVVPIDMDIILFNNDKLQLGKRIIPDQNITRFAHVALPLAEIAPDYFHEQTKESIEEIVKRLQGKRDNKFREDLTKTLQFRSN